MPSLPAVGENTSGERVITTQKNGVTQTAAVLRSLFLSELMERASAFPRHRHARILLEERCLYAMTETFGNVARSVSNACESVVL